MEAIDHRGAEPPPERLPCDSKIDRVGAVGFASDPAASKVDVRPPGKYYGETAEDDATPDDPDLRQIVAGLLIAYGNFVGVAAATAKGLGVPAFVVSQMVERVDHMNHGTMPSNNIASLFSEQLARVIAALDAD